MAAAGLVATTLTYPLDLVKTRLQVQVLSQRESFMHLSADSSSFARFSKDGWSQTQNSSTARYRGTFHTLKRERLKRSTSAQILCTRARSGLSGVWPLDSNLCTTAAGHCSMIICKCEGASSLYSGLSAGILGSSIAWGGYFFV